MPSRTKTTVAAFDPEKMFFGLNGKGGVAQLPVGPDFWATLDENPAARGTLITVGESDRDWPHWEMHPKGDEVVYVLEGGATIVLETTSGEKRLRVKAGQVFVNPAGVWHRALVPKRCRMLFVTYGEGTKHKPVVKGVRR